MRSPYPNYRHSGVEWLDRVPEHWETRRLSRSVNRLDIKVEPDDEELSPYIGLEHVTSWTGKLLPLSEGQEPESLCNSFTTGTVLFAKLRPYLAKAFDAHFDGLCSTEFLTLEPNDYERRYLLYLLLTDGVISLIDSSTYGAKMPRANWNFIGDVLLPVPTRDEQRSIVAFLDRETAKIDSLISKKCLLLDRLAEFRTALITSTVTKGLPPQAAQQAGLNPAPPLKASGVEWLGDIPEHWGVRRLGTALAETVGGGTPDTSNEAYWADDDEDGLPWVAISDMSAGGDVAATAKRVTPQGRSVARLKPLPAGTIIYSMYASVGAVARLSISAVTNQAILGLVPEDTVTSSFLYWWLSSVRKPVLALTRDNTQSNLNAETVGKIPLAIPPLDEQQAIASFLDGQTERIDDLWERVETAIERLQEYRTALITAAVTGKIDVREQGRVKAGARV